MLDVSRVLNPDREHLQCDMRTVRLGREFDCVFVHDAVCYMTTLEDLGTAAIEDFLEIDGIGEQAARSLVDFFGSETTRDMLNRLHASGVSPIAGTSPGNQKLSGMTFLFTGSLEKLSRDEAKKLVKEHGGTIASSVTKKVSHVVAGEKAGSKLAKAREAGKTILTENEFVELLK